MLGLEGVSGGVGLKVSSDRLLEEDFSFKGGFFLCNRGVIVVSGPLCVIDGGCTVSNEKV